MTHLIRIPWRAFATGMLMCRLSPAAAQASPPNIRDLLVLDLELSPADLEAVSRGEVVAKALATRDERDVAVIAVARADRHVRSSLMIPPREAHLFARPASLTDVQNVRVAPDDVNDLRQCRPGSCNFKLPASDMESAP